MRNNDFEFGSVDLHGETCPFAAHLRKSYYRNDLNSTANGAMSNEGEMKSEADTQKHRIMRGGSPFGPEKTRSEETQTTYLPQVGTHFVSNFNL